MIYSLSSLSAPNLWVKFVCALLLSLVIAHAEMAFITMDASKAGPLINPRMYGIFLEEINHGVDGGLYAELIRNRAFEDSRPPEGYTFRNGRWRNAALYDRAKLRPGNRITGPAVITELSATTWLPTGWVAVVDALSNLLLTPPAGARQ